MSCDILNGFRSSNASMFLRGHSKRSIVPFCKYSIKKTFFTYRILPIWNCLQSTTVCTNIYKSFINRLNDIDVSKHLR